MRSIPQTLAALVVPILFPLLLSAQSFPPNADLTKQIALLGASTQVQAMVVDATGNVYLAGTFQGAFAATKTLGPLGDSNLIVIKTNAAGDQVLYATAIGGSNAESLRTIKVDASGNVYLLGSTTSLDMPFASTANPTNPVGSFALKLNATGTALTYARQMGSRMTALDLDIDSSGAAYVVGAVASGDVTTTGGVLKPNPGAGVGVDDVIGFIGKLATSGQSFDVLTYYGLSGQSVERVSVRSNGLLILANGTLAQLNAALSSQTNTATTNLSPANLTFDSNGNVYMAGATTNGSSVTVRKFAAADLSLQLDKNYQLQTSTSVPQIAVAPNGRIFLFGQPFDARFFNTLNSTQACLANIGAPNGIAGWAGLSAGGLVGTTSSVPPEQAMLILDAAGNLLHATFTSSTVSEVAIAPTNGRVYTAATQTLFTTPDVTYWRGLVRFNQDQIPAVTVAPACILHSASFASTGLSPGAMMSVFGTHLGPTNYAYFQLDNSGRLPTTLGGVSVTVDGKASPMIYAQDAQINFIVPWSIRTDGSAVPVCVTYDSATKCIQATTTPTVPGIFTCNFTTNDVCAANEDGTFNTAAKPIAAGKAVVLFMTGFGTVNGPLVDGSVYNDYSIDRKVTAQVTGYLDSAGSGGGGCGLFSCAGEASSAPISVEYAGAAPTFVFGVDQVNIRIPAGTTSGAKKVTLSVLPSGATVPVMATFTVYVQ